MHEVWKIERGLWLEGVDAYRNRLADQSLMVFGPIGILRRDEILASIEQAPRWQDVEITEQTLLAPDDSPVIIVAYHAEARRDAGGPTARSAPRPIW